MGSIKSINEQTERNILKANGGRGSLVPVQQGRPGHGAVVTVHGINGSPDEVAPLANNVPKDKTVLTFAYDDRKTRLGDSSQQLADSLRDWARKHPKENLNVRAHSMGARISVDALRKLSEQGGLPKNVKLDLVAPAVAGFGAANTASSIPDGIARLIPNTAPGKDMGTRSEFQRRLETTTLPPQIKTRIIVGDSDKLIDPADARFQQVADKLNAQVKIQKGEDHLSILGYAGKTL